MTEKRKKACGIDVHKDFFVATILDCDGSKPDTRQFQNKLSSITDLRRWILENNCDVAAFESTGSYWYTLQRCLSSVVPVEVANAYYIKHVPGKKTDTVDSEWIAQLQYFTNFSPLQLH